MGAAAGGKFNTMDVNLSRSYTRDGGGSVTARTGFSLRQHHYTAMALILAALLPGCSDGSDDRVAGPIEVANETAWPMHHIDGRYRGANGLGTADVDGDHHNDYVTNYEFDQRWILALHPGDHGALRSAWPVVEIWRPEPLVSGNGKNPESTTLGDFDGDGNIDAAGAHGFSDILAFEGSAPGIHIVWGPSAERIGDADAWIDAGWVPATVDIGHPHWVTTHDVNGDGLTDVALGGRLHGGGGGYENPDSPNGNGSYTGIGWLEAPADPALRRDLSRWQFHRIDPDEFSGHGFVFADLDGDGDADIVDANADFDTPEDREEVVWYEHPGNASDTLRGEWRRNVLLRSPDFFAKPSVAAGDLDGDGDLDIATQTERNLILFRNELAATGGFEVFTLPKPDPIAWRARTVRLADFDRDGDLDIAGMLTHADNTMPADKASVFVLLNEGRPFAADGWRYLPVKWGSGSTMIVPGFGEKWDQADVTDVDGDGDLDIVANCEEWWVEARGEVAPFFWEGLATSSVAVVWFENTLGETARRYREEEGIIDISAALPTEIGDSTWVERAPLRAELAAAESNGEALSDSVAMQAHNGLRPAGDSVAATDSIGLRYALEVAGGDYTVWLRRFVPAKWGPALGGDRSDSVWLVTDGGTTLLAGDEAGGPVDAWEWIRLASPVALDAGQRELYLRVREHGAAIDRIVLARDPAFSPD